MPSRRAFGRTFPTEGKPTNPTDAIPVLLVDAYTFRDVAEDAADGA